jgi:hypothetical protein
MIKPIYDFKPVCVQDVSRAKLAALLQTETVVTPSAPTQKDEADRKPEYPKPDTSQMIPYQPRHLARTYLTPSSTPTSYNTCLVGTLPPLPLPATTPV